MTTPACPYCLKPLWTNAKNQVSDYCLTCDTEITKVFQINEHEEIIAVQPLYAEHKLKKYF